MRSPALVSFKDELMSRILAGGDAAATCTEALFTDSRLRVFRGTPGRQTGLVADEILLFGDNSSKIKATFNPAEGKQSL
jgi:hypothetical protein